jgi:hypothetical protein
MFTNGDGQGGLNGILEISEDGLSDEQKFELFKLLRIGHLLLDQMDWVQYYDERISERNG